MTHKSYMCIVWNGRNWYSSTLSAAFDCCAQQQRVTSLPLWNMPLPRSFIWLFTIMFESNISSLARYLQIQLFSVEENVTHGDESCTRKRCYVTKDFLVIPQNWKGLCAKYLQHKYGRESAVLDAYLMNPSTKDLTRMQWNKGCIGPEIHFTPDMTCTFSKEVFMPMGLLPDTQNCRCACAGNAGNVFPVTAGKRSRHASRHVRHARAVMHVGIAN